MKKNIVAVAVCLLLTGTADAKEAPRYMTDTVMTETAESALSKVSSPVRNPVFRNGILQEDVAPSIGGGLSSIGQVMDIDLQTAVIRATQNSRDIRIAEYKQKQAAATVNRVAAEKNPSLAYSMGWGRSRSGTPNAYGQRPIIEGYTNGVSIRVPIWTGGLVEGKLDEARYAENIAFIDVYQKEAEVKLAAITAYYQYLEAIHLSDITEEAVNNLTGHLRNVEQQYNAGIVAKLDVLASDVSLANAKQENIAAVNGRNLAEANLNNLMRVPMETTLRAMNKTFPEPTMDITMEQAIAMAQTYRWELIKADYNMKIAMEEVRVAKAGYMPTVGAEGGYNWQDKEFPGFNYRGWSIGAKISWSIWDGGKAQSDVKLAKAALQEAQETLLRAREMVALEVRKEYLNVLSAKEKINAASAAVKQGEQAYKIATVRYRSGVGINLDVLDGQLALNQAKANYIIALYEYNIGLAKLEKAMGLPALEHPERP